MSKDFRQQIDKIGTSDAQPAGIQILDEDENLIIYDFLTLESAADTHTSDENYKYPDDKLESNVPLNVKNINLGVLDSKLQRDHFQGYEDTTDEEESNRDDNNDEDDYASVISTTSISIHSANITNANSSSNNEMDIDIILTQNDDDDSTTSKEPEQIPKELQFILDGQYWLRIGLVIDDTTPDLAVNLDKFYWDNNNAIGEDTSIVLSTIIQYPPIEPSYALAAMYQVEPNPIEQEQHASKTTPQYGFQKGMKEFVNERREATKQELYENLLGMDAVTIVRPCKLKEDLCINSLTYLMFLKQKRPEKVKTELHWQKRN